MTRPVTEKTLVRMMQKCSCELYKNTRRLPHLTFADIAWEVEVLKVTIKHKYGIELYALKKIKKKMQ